MKCRVCGSTVENVTVCEFCGFYILSAPLISGSDINKYKDDAKAWKGKLADPDQFRIKGNVLEKYTGNSDCVAVPGNICIIDSHCFAQKTGVKKVLIPASVEFIGKNEDDNNNGAFWACFDLEELLFEENSQLKTIGKYSFYQCSKLHNIRGLPSRIQQIKSHAFKDCLLNKETLQSIEKTTLDIADDWNK